MKFYEILYIKILIWFRVNKYANSVRLPRRRIHYILIYQDATNMRIKSKQRHRFMVVYLILVS